MKLIYMSKNQTPGPGRYESKEHLNILSPKNDHIIMNKGSNEDLISPSKSTCQTDFYDKNCALIKNS